MPKANEGMLQLVKLMGGRQEAVDAINAAKDEAKDEAPVVTLRQLNGWIYADSMPAHAHFYLLAATAHKNLDLRTVLAALPDLIPAARMIAAIYRPKVAA